MSAETVMTNEKPRQNAQRLLARARGLLVDKGWTTGDALRAVDLRAVDDAPTVAQTPDFEELEARAEALGWELECSSRESSSGEAAFWLLHTEIDELDFHVDLDAEQRRCAEVIATEESKRKAVANG